MPSVPTNTATRENRTHGPARGDGRTRTTPPPTGGKLRPYSLAEPLRPPLLNPTPHATTTTPMATAVQPASLSQPAPGALARTPAATLTPTMLSIQTSALPMHPCPPRPYTRRSCHFNRSTGSSSTPRCTASHTVHTRAYGSRSISGGAPAVSAGYVPPGFHSDGSDRSVPRR